MWNEVMHNLLYFMHELVPAAASRTNWNQDSIDKAVSWGAYCEKISRQFRHNYSMRIAFSCLARQSLWAMTFHDLQSARQLLLKIFIQNQLLDLCVKEYVHQVANTVVGPTITATLYQQAVQQNSFCNQLMNVLTDMKYEIVKRRLGTRLMVEAASSSGQDKLQDCLTEMVMFPEGLSMILSTVKQDKEAGSVDRYFLLSPSIVEWLEGVMTSLQDSRHRQVVRTLCTLPPALLNEVFNGNLSIFRLLMSFLNKEAKKLEPYYNSKGCCWLPHNPTASILSYQDLVCVYTALLKVEGVGLYAQEKVLSFCLQDGGAVWSDVIRDANAEEKLEQ
ncbi:uncharacterized protein [Panulirus ornatus]|uniref:uncharacterized protein n=1 Tax=Panulirus ornatus TaxID=150431 RepID=UPI003A8B3C34